MRRSKGKTRKVKASKNQRTGKKLAVKEGDLGVLQKKLNRAVVYIAMKDRGFGDRLENIGAYIIKHFFFGDVERVKSKNPIKGFSLRQLADKKGVEMSLTSLHRCVELAVQQKELGSFSALKKLSTTHRIGQRQLGYQQNNRRIHTEAQRTNPKRCG